MGNENSGRPRGPANGPGYRNYTLRLPETIIERIDRLSEYSALPRYQLVATILADGLDYAEAHISPEVVAAAETLRKQAVA